MYNLRKLQAPPRDALARTCQGGCCSFFAIDAKTPLSLFPPTNFKETVLLRPHFCLSLPPSLRLDLDSSLGDGTDAPSSLLRKGGRMRWDPQTNVGTQVFPP